jgi:FtsH-binding integral membrane protein
MEGAIIVLACMIFSVFASSPPTVDADAAAASMVWSYIGELVFNMLILVGTVKMADRVVHEMMGL